MIPMIPHCERHPLLYSAKKLKNWKTKVHAKIPRFIVFKWQHLSHLTYANFFWFLYSIDKIFSKCIANIYIRSFLQYLHDLFMQPFCKVWPYSHKLLLWKNVSITASKTMHACWQNNLASSLARCDMTWPTPPPPPFPPPNHPNQALKDPY